MVERQAPYGANTPELELLDLAAVERLLAAVPETAIRATGDQDTYIDIVALYAQAPRLLAALVAEVKRLRTELAALQEAE